MASDCSVQLPTVTDWFAEPAEEDLCARLARGEVEAVGATYDLHHRAVRAFARRLLGDESQAEDLVHEVFIALPRAMTRFRGESSLRTFLLSIASNLSRRHLRSARRRRAAQERLSLEPLASPTNPEDATGRSELARRLTAALDRLGDEHRLAFVLCEVEERSSPEVSQILGIPEGTVRTRLFHAKQKLRTFLSQEHTP